MLARDGSQQTWKTARGRSDGPAAGASGLSLGRGEAAGAPALRLAVRGKGNTDIARRKHKHVPAWGVGRGPGA